MTDKYTSSKIVAISFLLQIFVVLIHSINLIFNFGEESLKAQRTLNSFTQNFISKGLTNIAVPMFFIISGYLFFCKIKTGTTTEFKDKFKNRFKTLAIPYLFWSLSGILLFFILQSFPFSKPFFTKDLVQDYDFDKWIRTLFYLPIAAQLWFIRDLIVLIIISPLLYRLLSLTPKAILLFSFVFWCSNTRIYLFSPESLLFFLIGSYWGISKISLQNLPRVKNSTLLLVLWIVLITVKTLLTENHFHIKWMVILLNKASIITGIIALWYFYDILYKDVDITQKRYYVLFKYSFWIYVAHQPLLNIIKKALLSVMGFTNTTSFIVYLAAPLITLLIIIPTAILLRRYVPKFYFFTTGGR
ncbi:acyltransferase family protein [Flavobacterium sp. Sd200]|uniref:acyltransferase family protein n=1 Tax=Flavobacterium sp. Sd200 TaxID=2692211 RepID=UPI00136E5C4A|nr:acyltransferase [Flavobacterium sp. Sd200]MXN93023.1 acyltransferase family protein [Flavobacterium sp. Sd200]